MNPIILKEALLDQFEAYQSGGMSLEEKARFENRLETEPELQASYRNFMTSREAIEIKIANDLKARMKTWDKQGNTIKLHPKAGPIRRLKWPAWAAAASLLFILSFGLAQYRAVKSYPMNAIAEYQPIQVLTMRNGDRNSGLNNIIREYTGKSTTAEQTISALLKISPEAPDNEYQKAQGYLAKLYLRQGLCTEAAASYQRAGDLEGARDEAEIGKVLCLIREGHNRDDILAALKPILDNENHSFNLAAREIDKEVNSLRWRLFK